MITYLIWDAGSGILLPKLAGAMDLPDSCVLYDHPGIGAIYSASSQKLNFLSIRSLEILQQFQPFCCRIFLSAGKDPVCFKPDQCLDCLPGIRRAVKGSVKNPFLTMLLNDRQKLSAALCVNGGISPKAAKSNSICSMFQ